MQLRHRLLQRPATPLCLCQQRFRYRPFVQRRSPGQRTHADEVDDAGEPVLGPDRQLHHQRHGAQPRPDRLHRLVEIRTRPVELVDERDPRHAMPIRLSPHGFALRLDTGDAVEHRDSPVQHAQGPFDLVGEVDVPGRVDEVDAMPVPRAAHGRGEDRDAAVALLRVEVRDGRAVVDLTALVGGAGGEQDAFGEGGLARVDVGEDAEVADSVQRGRAHG